MNSDNPLPEIIRTQRRIVGDLEENGLTPFDLCSWTTLLYLVEASKEFHVDLNVWNDTMEEIRKAAKRKAEALDEHKDTDFHRNTLKSFIPEEF